MENEPNQQPTSAGPVGQVSPNVSAPQQPSYQANPAISQPIPQAEQPKKRKHLILRIAVGVVIVLALIIGFFVLAFIHANSDVKDAKVVSDKFVQDMVSGDTQSAYQLTSNQFQQTTTESSLAAIAKVVHQNVTGQPTENDWNINNTTGQPETATIDYAATGANGSGKINMTLQKINGQWQVVHVYFPSFAIQGYTVQ